MVAATAMRVPNWGLACALLLATPSALGQTTTAAPRTAPEALPAVVPQPTAFPHCYKQPRPGAVAMRFESEGAPLRLDAIYPSQPPAGRAPYAPHDFACDTPNDPVIRGQPASPEPSAEPFKYATVCDTPCTLFLQPGRARFMLHGEGVRPSEEQIAVGPEPRRITLYATPTSRAVTAFSLTYGGPMVFGLGAGALLIDAGRHDWSRIDALGGAGIAMMTVGAAATAVGVAMLFKLHSGVRSSEPMPATVSRAPEPARAGPQPAGW